jgi:hypothetical protein
MLQGMDFAFCSTPYAENQRAVSLLNPQSLPAGRQANFEIRTKEGQLFYG